MDLEKQLRESYAERLGALESSGADAGTARREGARLKARRRVAVGVAAVSVVAVAVAGRGLLGTGGDSIGPAHGAGHWRELPPAPLSPRADALAVWTGKKVVVVGGETNPCPPGAECANPAHPLDDGAAYDPATNTWKRIAPAPVPVDLDDRLVSAGGRVVLQHHQQGGTRAFVYAPADDEWFEIPAFLGGALSAYGDRVYGFHHGRVVAYDAPRGLWDERIPRDRIQPRLVQRQVTATAVGPVISGYNSTTPQDGTVPSVVLADVYDGRHWHRFPATGQLGNAWFWNGSRMVVPDPTMVDGGAVNPYPRAYPEGGMLDPSTGRWSPLARAFSGTAPGWAIYAVGGRWATTYGHVYDTQTGRVTVLPVPEGKDSAGSGTTAVWAGDQLLAFGGSESPTDATGGSLTNRAWLYTP